MRILLASVGTRGDVQPYLCLAQALSRAGHEPLVTSHPCMAGLAADFGVEFAPMGPDVDMTVIAADIRRSSRVWMLGMIKTMKFTLNVLERSHGDLQRLVQGCDLVVAAHSAAGGLEAEQAGVPMVSTHIFPQAIPEADPSRKGLAGLTDALGGAVMGAVMTSPYNKMRRRLGVGPMGPDGVMSSRLNLIPISPEVVPPNPMWAPQHQATGYWLPASDLYEPVPELEAFLADGPVVAVSLGAMSDQETNAILVKAAERAGVRVLVQGWRGEPLTGSARAVDAVPHGWLFPRVAAVVHHGGLGTTGSGFSAGTPALVVPHVLDQFYWGQRVHDLGCGPRPISVKKLTLGSATAALADLASNGSYQHAAKIVADRLAGEDGVATAVRLIEKEFASSAAIR